MLEKMKEIIAEQLGVEEDEITLDTSFKEDLGADSLDLCELTMALEEEYDIEIPAEELEEIELEGEGLLARAFCHEIDHLEGRIYVDLVEGELRNVEYQEEEEEEEL